jgi:hypothetical protein
VKRLLGELDALLRGNRTGQAQLAAGDIQFGLTLSIQAVILLGGVYGLCMGLFALTDGHEGAWLQLLASTLKLPSLFLLTLVVTCPSLYVFSVLAGSQLRFFPVLRLLLATSVVTVAVSASLAPILAFFTLSSRSYSFMVLLNVALLGAAGFVGLTFLRRALLGLMLAVTLPHPRPTGPTSAEQKDNAARAIAPPSGESAPYPDPPLPIAVRDAPVEDAFRRQTAGLNIFRIWLLTYAVVGAQMGWLLRPFIGSPDTPFMLFRNRGGNFFEAVLSHLINVFK